MHKKFSRIFYLGLICLSVILFTVSCESLKNYDTGAQNEAYVKDYNLVANSQHKAFFTAKN